MALSHAQPGFAPSKGKKRKRKPAKPTEQQIKIAKRRVIGMMNKCSNRVGASSVDEFNKICARHVYNRGRQLGDYQNGEFSLVIGSAVRELVAEGILKFCEPRGEHSFMECSVKARPRRKHADKYRYAQAA